MSVAAGPPTHVRYGVMGYLCSLAFILYVDRICIGQAGTYMMEDLRLSPSQWGLVGGAFMIAYAVFEVITGHWGDRFGSRRVLTRIVLWWSAFTALTGCVHYFSFEIGGVVVFNSFLLLLLIRFLFGAGEAGALPNSARVVARWFPPGRRGPSQALISMSAQLGGAAAPAVAAELIWHVGWRWSFVIFGSMGVVWAWLFSRWFRDDPAKHPGVNAAELAYITAGAPPPSTHHPAIPWRQVLRSANIWLLGTAIACSSFYSYMLFFWFPTYLKQGRGRGAMSSGWLASMPLALGAVGVMLGGFLGDWLTIWLRSRRRALRIMGSGGLALASVFVATSVLHDDLRLTVLWCAVGFFFADIALAAWWAAMGDVGGRHLGALFGFCNMLGLAGGFVSQVSLGFFVDLMKRLGYSGRAQWDPAFYVFGGVLLVGSICWLFIDPSARPFATIQRTLDVESSPSLPQEDAAMRWFTTLALFLGPVMSAQADTFVYVSMAPEQKIQVYRLDTKDGKLTAVETLAVDGSPGCLSIDPQKKYLFASLRTTSTLASFRIDPATGKLKHLSTAALPKGENAAFVGTDRTGRWLLSASYAAGKVVVHGLKEDGTIQTPAVQTVETAKTAHSVATDRDNRFVFVPHVSPNAVYQFRLDVTTGKLTEAEKAPGGAEKAGPRHIALHPRLEMAFTSDEQGSSITAYRLEATGLKPVQTLSTLPADFKRPNSTAEVKVHPSGKFVWVSNRGHESLAGFAIDAAGKLTALGHTPTEKTPRSFEIEPDGQFAFGAGEGSGKLAVFRVDTDTGKLTRLHTQDVGKSLTWVLAVKFADR